MFLCDYHNHTRCSPDSEARLTDMVQAAHRAGLQELCTTDHYDLLREDGSVWDGWDWTPVLEQFEAARPQVPKDFHLLLGLELGGAPVDPKKAEETLAGVPLDLVIGSIHNFSSANGGIDFFYPEYSSREEAASALNDYFASMLALAALPCYDTLGHIIYPLRYINDRAGCQITLDPWLDRIDAILRIVIETGRAIEINTNRGRTLTEWLPILRRYRELGGELVTTGSDAHLPGDVGKGILEAVQLLEETGFRYLTRYRRRRPEPIKL